MSRSNGSSTSTAPIPLTESESGSQRVAILGPEEVVVPVVFDPSEHVRSDIGAGQSTNAPGTLGLCPPRAPEVVPVVLPDDVPSESTPQAAASALSGDGGQGGAAEPEASADAGVADELPEALQLLDMVGTDEDPYAAGGSWAYADAEDLGGRCFFVTQNEQYLGGRVLLTEEQIAKAVGRKGMTRWAWIKHDKDVYSAEEAAKIPSAVAGEPKADHFHIAVERKSFATLGVIARAFGVPPNCVEIKPQGAFMDLVEYLTHENPNQLAKGKHLYGDEEVHANFDWRPMLEEHKLARSFKAGSRANVKRRDRIRLDVMRGEVTLKQVRESDTDIYVQDYDKLHKLRQDFMLHQPAPRHRTNYFMGGVEGEVRKGRTGKTALAKIFARSLFPELDADECYHVATDRRVPLQTYKGQPVIIWDDYHAIDLMEALGGRSGVWQVFDDHPSANDVNIKYGSTRLVHAVNIVTKTTPYARFLDDLAGEYVGKDGTQHLAEDRNQSWGRFPVVFEVTVESIEMLLNRGFVDDIDDFLAYQKVARMRASMKQVCAALDSIEDDEERDFATYQVGEVLLRPMLDQHAALQPAATRAGAEVVAELLSVIEVEDGAALAAGDVARAAERKAREDALAARRAAKEQVEAQALAERQAQCTCGPEMRWEPYLGEHHKSVDCPLISDWDREFLERAAQREAEEVAKKVERLKRGEPIVSERAAS